MEFPGSRLATFVCSFGATDVSEYEVVGTEGRARLDPAYEYVGELEQSITVRGKRRSRTFMARDQFAAELLYFSDCILRNHAPEPSGMEGLIDVSIIEALYRSARIGRPVELKLPPKKQWPTPHQTITRPPVRKPRLVNVKSPTL